MSDLLYIADRAVGYVDAGGQVVSLVADIPKAMIVGLYEKREMERMCKAYITQFTSSFRQALTREALNVYGDNMLAFYQTQYNSDVSIELLEQMVKDSLKAVVEQVISSADFNLFVHKYFFDYVKRINGAINVDDKTVKAEARSDFKLNYAEIARECFPTESDVVF